MTAHWGVPDPAAITGTPEEIDRAFSDAFSVLDRRISLFLCLPLSSLDTFALQKELDDIGKELEGQECDSVISPALRMREVPQLSRSTQRVEETWLSRTVPMFP